MSEFTDQLENDLENVFLNIEEFGETISFQKSPPSLEVHTCEAAWDELVDGDSTVTADAVVFKVGTKSMKAVVAAAVSAGDIVATDNFTAKNLSTYTHLGLWFRSSVALDAGDYQILLDDTAQCASPIETLNLPEITAAQVDTWVFCKLALATPASDTAIVSIGFKCAVDKPGTFYLDGIEGFQDVQAMVTYGSGDAYEGFDDFDIRATVLVMSSEIPAVQSGDILTIGTGQWEVIGAKLTDCGMLWEIQINKKTS